MLARVLISNNKDHALMELAATASALTARGKGLLASDESTGTIGKRLEKAGLVNDEVIVAQRPPPPSCPHPPAA